MPERMHDEEVDVDPALIRSLLQSQMPSLADLPLLLVEPWGTDNAIWRLGNDLVVRLPRVASATAQVAFEDEWLPVLSSYLSLCVPEPVAVGNPGHGYPYPWAVHRWIDGVGAGPDTIVDPVAFATQLAEVVMQLAAIPTTNAREARNRARPLGDYDQATRQAIDSASHLIDADAALAVWEQGLAAAPHGGEPVWVHGDLEGNCLTLNGQLHGLLDWGSACAGDPAVDVQVVWSPLFTSESRQVFCELVGADQATLDRSRAAAINQACGALPYYLETYPLIVERSWHKLAQLGVMPAAD